jgi:hypothetical protein
MGSIVDLELGNVLKHVAGGRASGWTDVVGLGRASVAIYQVAESISIKIIGPGTSIRVDLTG